MNWLKTGTIVVVFLFPFLVSGQETAAGHEFIIRGVLPWHNFLSGPSAWNEQDYEKYLDYCREKGINFIAFHNYTGGGQRYFNYVEPMIRIRYKNVLPEAGFDHSGMSRWGYLPMKVEDFPYGTAQLYDLPEGAEYFGADCAVTAKNNNERYDKAQALMKKVLEMAHERDMEMALGFEFGVAPPEYASVFTHPDMYWMGNGSLVYNPFDPDATGILYATIDDILHAYEGLDWIYLWLNEHCMWGVDVQEALKNNRMRTFYEENARFYENEQTTASLKFLGVWAQAYIQKAYDYIKQHSPGTRIAIGGWGGKEQMMMLLEGLNKMLPDDIAFSMLNPGQGAEPHPDFFSQIAENRRVWAIPWLEGDQSLWHLQPRVDDMRLQVSKAARDGLDGVIGIHWRTEEIRENFAMFTHYANNPGSDLSTYELYEKFYQENYGKCATENLAPLLAQYDISGTFGNIISQVYYAYTPQWGRLNEDQKEAAEKIIRSIENCLAEEKGKEKRGNLHWLKACFEFMLLFDQVSTHLEPAWELRDRYYSGIGDPGLSKEVILEARKELEEAPVEKMIRTFASRVRSRGELGELSSINQRVYREYLLLKDFLNNL